MRLSVNVPNFGTLPERIGLGTMAREAEAAGADGVWVADHLLLIDEVMTGYPYAPDGIFPNPGTFPFYESLACCAYLAAATERCRIGIGVLVLPQRNVLELAKAAATIDRLSGGRFALGVGSGWNRLEMEALGYLPGNRGERTDEMMQVLRDCWDGMPHSYAGRQISVRAGVMLFPTPVRQGGVPLLVGGMSNVALRRAAAHGDGWLAITFADRLNVDALRERVEHVCALRADSGKPSLDLVLKLHADPRSAGELPEAVAAVAGLGFDEVVIDVPWVHGVKNACEVLASCRRAAPAVAYPEEGAAI
jgi:probable F420-dependent oxidoreductase